MREDGNENKINKIYRQWTRDDISAGKLWLQEPIYTCWSNLHSHVFPLLASNCLFSLLDFYNETKIYCFLGAAIFALQQSLQFVDACIVFVDVDMSFATLVVLNGRTRKQHVTAQSGTSVISYVNSQDKHSHLYVNSHGKHSQFNVNSHGKHSQLFVNSQGKHIQLYVNSHGKHFRLYMNSHDRCGHDDDHDLYGLSDYNWKYLG